MSVHTLLITALAGADIMGFLLEYLMTLSASRLYTVG
jgi:hypothetical protein